MRLQEFFHVTYTACTLGLNASGQLVATFALECESCSSRTKLLETQNLSLLLYTLLVIVSVSGQCHQVPADFEPISYDAASALGISTLKLEQEEATSHFLQRRDVFVALREKPMLFSFATGI